MKVVKAEGQRLAYLCPGCKKEHRISIAPITGWGFNNDFQNPTFTPSVNWTNGTVVCHHFVKDGMVQFLSDCTHENKDKTLPMVDFPAEWLEPKRAAMYGRILE